MELDLHGTPSGTPVFTGGFSIDNLTWWFWVKAGIGFTVGAGIAYAVFAVVWVWIIAQVPALLFLRAFSRL